MQRMSVFPQINLIRVFLLLNQNFRCHTLGKFKRSKTKFLTSSVLSPPHLVIIDMRQIGLLLANKTHSAIRIPICGAVLAM